MSAVRSGFDALTSKYILYVVQKTLRERDNPGSMWMAHCIVLTPLRSEKISDVRKLPYRKINPFQLY